MSAATASTGRRRLARVSVLLLLSTLMAVGVDRPAGAAANELDTVAGSAGAGPALSTAVNPRGVAVFGGLLYVADPAGDVIRRIDLATSTASVVAGTGVAGQGGDGGPAVLAELNDPTDVSVDANGDLYVADSLNHRIRKVTVATGVITTFAGTGSSDGIIGDNGPAAEARLITPRAVTVDAAGDVYIADTGSTRIRRVAAGTGVITTIAAGYTNIVGIAVDGAGNVFISGEAHRVIKLAAGGGASIVAGIGASGYNGDGIAATSARLRSPVGIEVDSAGNLYIADSVNQRVRKVTAATGLISTIAGNGTAGLLGDGGAATAARVNTPTDVALDADGSVYFGQSSPSALTPNDSVVRKVGPTQVISTVAGNGWVGFAGDGAAAAAAQFQRPAGTAVDGVGNVYVADSANHRVRRFAPGGAVSTVAGNGLACGNPCNHAVIGDGGQATAANLHTPMAVAVDAAGNVLISDHGHHRVRRVDHATGVITTIAGTGSATPFGGDGGPATAAVLNLPVGLTTAPDGSIYVADYGNHRVRRIDPLGVITTVAGDGSSAPGGDGGPATASGTPEPYDVELGPAGELYLAESAGHRVRVVSNGVISTVAGTGAAGYSGDGGAATAAQLNQPVALALDAVGNLLIAERANGVVRRITAGGLIDTMAGTPATGEPLAQPSDLAFDADGGLFIADVLAHRIRSLPASVGVATWWSSDTTTGHAGARYAWRFRARTPAAVAAVTMTVPPGTAGTPSVSAIYGLPVGGTVSLVADAVTYTLAQPAVLDDQVELYVAVDGFTNTAAAGDHVSTVTTVTGGGVAIDVSTSDALTFAASAPPTPVPVPVRDAAFAISASSQEISLDPSAPQLRDRTAATTLDISTNAPGGYALWVGAGALVGPAGSIPPVSASVHLPVPPGAFPPNAAGYAVAAPGGTGVGVRQGGLGTGGYVGYPVGPEQAVIASVPAGADAITFTDRVRIDYSTAAGTYTSVVTYVLEPRYG